MPYYDFFRGGERSWEQAYDGRNPRTGKVIRVAEKHLPFFKVGKELRERVDGKKALE